MRATLPALLALALPALAATDDAWQAFRAEVRAACLALAGDAGEVTVEVNPFGSETYGAALVEVTAAGVTECRVCVYDKRARSAELTTPFGPPAK